MTIPSNEASQEQVQYSTIGTTTIVAILCQITINLCFEIMRICHMEIQRMCCNLNLLQNLIVNQVRRRCHLRNASFKKADSRLDNIETHSSIMGATTKNLEVQLGQLATTINAQQRGAFPSNTEMNPNEQCKAITLRSGREIERSSSKESKSTPTVANNGQRKNKVEEEEIVNYTLRETDVLATISFPNNPPILSTPLPYPQHFQKQKLDKQFSKFLDIFKKIHINIPFADALEQMPNYVKFLKDIISKKRRLEEFEIVKLSEECSAILQKTLPQKLKDPGSFTLPCTIGNSFFDKFLCDLGASINLMPLSVFRKLGLGEMKQTTISLQLVDGSIKYPLGIIEDVLVKLIERVSLNGTFVKKRIGPSASSLRGS
ncbi:uncharacterized protein [Aristolochia californica]|uniref:uncharacterized protein n=1 Tax=Aristolochia californica TaxID=171875 RepID=UPI0035D5932A